MDICWVWHLHFKVSDTGTAPVSNCLGNIKLVLAVYFVTTSQVHDLSGYNFFAFIIIIIIINQHSSSKPCPILIIFYGIWFIFFL